MSTIVVEVSARRSWSWDFVDEALEFFAPANHFVALKTRAKNFIASVSPSRQTIIGSVTLTHNYTH